MERLAAVFMVLTLIACGSSNSSSDDSRATDPQTTFNLPDRNIVVGNSGGWNITGTASRISNPNETYDITGTLLWEVLIIEMYEGNEAYPLEEFASMSVDGVPTASAFQTIYYDMDLKPICMIDSDGDINTPIEIIEAPPSANIGDFGQLTTWQDDDGSVKTGNWRLEDAGNGYADYISTFTTKSNTGETDVYIEVTKRIDELGNVQSNTRVINNYKSDLRQELLYTER